MQNAVEKVLHKDIQSGFTIEREKALTPKDRPDFYVCGKDRSPRIAIELKVKGNVGSVWRQIDRYAALDAVDGVLLVTACHRLASGLQSVINGKPVAAVLVRGKLL